MTDYGVAIGRNVGRVNTDANGLCRYSLKLQLPPGIGTGNEPELSLEYCQGAPNGSLGVGWALGGMSCIRRAPSSLAYDGNQKMNLTPAEYDRSTPKLSLDGAELLNFYGKYGAPDALYSIESESVQVIVSHKGDGFVVAENTGHYSEYGTTEDSRVLVPGSNITREWRLKKKFDYYGNAITYQYTRSPQATPSQLDVNTCYLSQIRYTSNEKTGHLGNRLLILDYSSRPDVVVQTVEGGKCSWASLLSGVRIAVIKGDETTTYRSYEFAYERSHTTGDSMLTSVVEASIDGAQKVQLLPSVFGYTAPDLLQQEPFSIKPTVGLFGATNVVSLFTSNISGRGVADIACVQYDSAAQRVSIKSYLAERTLDGRASWLPSDGTYAEANLPLMNLSKGLPDILTPDMNSDGRSDLVVPYDDGRQLCFAICQSAGTGFRDAIIKKTNLDWKDEARFIAVSATGSVAVDVVQIVTEGDCLSFRTFQGVSQNDGIGSLVAVITHTQQEASGTIDWLQLTNPGTGANCLVRIWNKTDRLGQSQLFATTFTIVRDGPVVKGVEMSAESILGDVHLADVEYNVLPCDINADGTLDIVLATASHVAAQVDLTFETFLGDYSGGFQKHGEIVRRTIDVPAPTTSAGIETGNFQVTNLNGSNYPTLAYTWRTMTGAYYCVSVDGMSDGLFTPPLLHFLVSDLPSENMQIVSADLVGNGIGDWLLYSTDLDQPLIVPVVNQAASTGLLAWTRDSMGLRTEITYGTLADPAVYTPGVDWTTYERTDNDAYCLLGSGDRVVSSLRHSNDPALNSITYQTSVRKTYKQAKINFRGRGWQGFAEISNVDSSEGTLTLERYEQSFPKTGAKILIQMSSLANNALLKSISAEYRASYRETGLFKIWRSDQISEQVDLFDDYSNPVRSKRTKMAYDAQFNLVLKAESEIQQQSVVSQSWNRRSYTAIDNVACVLTGQKLSSKEGNTNMSAFEPGDISLTTYEHEYSRNILKSAKSWSTDSNSFATTHFQFDDYGHQISSIDPVGLTKTTTYDATFQTFPIKITWTGDNVASTEFRAYDEASGLQVARQEVNGAASFYRLDGFGRTCESRILSDGASSNTVTAHDFLATRTYVSDPGFNQRIALAQLDPQREISFVMQQSGNSKYMATRLVEHSHAGVGGQHEVVDYVDCVTKIRKRSSRSADDPGRVWIAWDFNPRGEMVFESLPTSLPIGTGPEWEPATTLGTSTMRDSLGRPVYSIRPAHNNQSHFVVTVTSYQNGGARSTEKTFSVDSNNLPPTNGVLSRTVQRDWISIGQQDRVVQLIDGTGSRLFEYDVAGRMITSMDSSGRKEIRTYNSQGSMATLNNPYQNNANIPGVPATKMQYDQGNRMIKRINAMQQTISYKRDAKGRIVQTSGSDGRTVKFEYDRDGYENVAAINVFKHDGDTSPESRFEYTYDYRGRLQERKLIREDGTNYVTTFSYDWQDRIVQKTLPDGATLKYTYRGSLLSSTTLSGGASADWHVTAENKQHNAYGKPKTIEVATSGAASPLTHDWAFDTRGFPLSHGFRADSRLLIQEDYIYNELDLINRKHDVVSGSTTDYRYDDLRLASSQTGDDINKYVYSRSGDLIQKGSLNMVYDSGRLTATKGGQTVVQCEYDAAGRLISRETPQAALHFAYNSLGTLESIQNGVGGPSATFVSDFDGEMFERRHSDGSSDLFLDEAFSVHIQADGRRVETHKLLSSDNSHSVGHLLATVSHTFESQASKRPLSGSRSVHLSYADLKGNITRTFAPDGSLVQHLEFDDYGLLTKSEGAAESVKTDATYEGTYLDMLSGLLNFRARWYDPLIGRFTTPDDIGDPKLLMQTDGMNRFCFENNDPINHTDPTGHWSLSAIVGLVVSVVAVVAAVVVTVVTAGAATPLLAATIGALASGGLAGITYSLDHRDEQNAGTFMKGFGMTVAINAAIGFASGGAGAYAGGLASTTGRIAATAAIGGLSSAASNVTQRGVDAAFYGASMDPTDVLEDAATSFGTGAALGGLGAIAGGRLAPSAKVHPLEAVEAGIGPRALRALALPSSTVNTQAGLDMATAKTFGKALLKPGGKMLWWAANDYGWVQRIKH